jgi:RNA polymerase sigma factor (sigma-70 family)
MTIARNLLIDRYRASGSAAGRDLPLEEIDPRALPTVNGAADLGVAPELAVALAGLKHRDQEILALRYGADLTGPEIASMTGLSLANVQQIISRGLRQLRESLEPPGQQ